MKRFIVLLILVLSATVAYATACTPDGGATESTTESSTTTTERTKPFRIGVNLGFSGATKADATMAERGLETALDQAGYTALGQKVEVFLKDNASDLITAVDSSTNLVMEDNVEALVGPLQAPSYAAVTDYVANYLGKDTARPCLSVLGMPTANLAVGNGLAVIPAGVHSVQGYYVGKYAADTLSYKTANLIVSSDKASREMMTAFQTAFVGEGGGKILSEQDVPLGTTDFSAFLNEMGPADATVWQMPGAEAAAFVRQYRDAGLASPLVLMTADSLPESELAALGDAALGITATCHYMPSLNNTANVRFVDDYTAQWGGERPTMAAFGGWLAMSIFLETVKVTNGDTTPAVLLKAMSTLTLDTPAGRYTLSPYQDAIIGTGDLYVSRTVESGGRAIWHPVYSYRQVLMAAPQS
ncbi:MAG: ABC transporter substrate-binding protein [Thermoleophilia bacterium]|nr:ABC transporter substrate-binding protein [Thermoleophilia bacterium]